MTPGRPRSTPPSLAWDRYITLVQALASDDPARTIIALCLEWGVDIHSEFTSVGKPVFDKFATACALAQHAIAYHREEEQEEAAPYTGEMPNSNGERVCDICGGHVGTECQCDERSYDEEG